MDIDLLAKMVKEAVMEHDCVTLPGLGSFVAELLPATFADRGYTILPPYRRLYFVPREGEDRLLATLYARDNDVSEADALRILTDFLTEMREVLKTRKTVIFPELGRLRATRENHFFFVADEDLDIYPAGFGLQPISLKTHEETPEEVAQAVNALADMLEEAPVKELAEEPAEEPAEDPVEEDVEEEPELQESEPQEQVQPESESEPEPASEEPLFHEESPWKPIWRFLLILLAVAVLAAVALAVLGRVAPEWLDKILYTPEELEIIRNA